MVDRQVTTTTGALLEEATIDDFQPNLRGQLIRPGDDSYDQARKIWNAMIDNKPGLIVRCAGVADVINSVNFARTNNLLVAVRGGGHNVAGNAISNGGITIDLSRMKGVYVEPQKRTARAEAGLTWGEFDHETQAFGLATTGGTISTTGIAGLTLGGGIGWLMGKHGLSCDNLISVDIVTASGNRLTANAAENADLFWGVRGAGPNFGVITSFEFHLHPVSQVLGGLLIYPIEKAREVLRFYREFISTAPDELGTMAVLQTSPEGQPVTAIGLCYNGPIEAGQQALAPIRAFGPPAADQVAPMPYTVLQSLLDAGFPAGFQNYWKSNFLKDLSDDAIDVVVDHFAKTPSPNSVVLIEQLGNAVNRVGQDITAFNHRQARFNLLVLGMWEDVATNDTNIEWVRTLWDAMQPFSSGGVYVNYLGQTSDEGDERVKAAYGPAKYERLVAIKNKYDPTNLFRLNQNIKPTV